MILSSSLIWSSSEVVTVLTFLLPGFVSAAVFYSLTSHPKPSNFASVVQALMFTAVVQAITVLLRVNLWEWSQEIEVFVSVAIALPIGLIAALLSNLDLPHRIFRRARLTKENTYSSEWYSAFAGKENFVVLHLKDSRRFFGWPSEWPTDPERGHFRVTQGQWLTEERENSESPDVTHYESENENVFELLIPVSEVAMVEFVYTESNGNRGNHGKDSD